LDLATGDEFPPAALRAFDAHDLRVDALLL
jgi:hypothetical protein